ncbi:hypothetical protein AMJ50_02450 [Parcubacteria bacterium DG_74_3]|nr:MAG: hypothetical protein AMJ50_02450 [Parcubacteria bacterium DG_74_3]
MGLRGFKKDERIQWTKHAKEKRRQYDLSERRLMRVLRRPVRIEKGIAPGTTAVMQRTGTKKHPTEIWLMYQKTKKAIRIISAWRYPGISPLGEPVPIPEDILEELDSIIKRE